ncbi:FtsB family cell division protein [Saccharomonospora piscinae]|uniref:Septum formation initiator n=1 Tax=Saccharomonospora piscinae TaxID=687388 RepID=A0A1V9A6F6_SACPI|nr:septum formation initiator family protein [Saccharomonospora piscinae]OQO92514.1 septum formation initiator [Saccharomonospora piscinae]TLW91781.1 septum formation initiator family protein [Saccharomonospora piscinae]
MAERGRSRSRRGGGKAGRSVPRRPRRVRRERRVARLRRLGAGRVADAAKALGLSTTRRAALVAIVVCALAFTIAVPLRTYFSQRADVAEQERQLTELETEVDQLERRRDLLRDPAQVEAEARRRLRYVMPGETPYMVQFPDTGAAGGEHERRPAIEPGAWYEKLWNSVTEE